MPDHNQTPSTDFLPSERADAAAVAASYEQVGKVPLLAHILNSLPVGVMILNPQRQIVFSNESMLRTLGASSERTVLGLRPGEALHCIHGDEEPGRCGTTEFCRECGAARAFLRAGGEDGVEEECRIIRKSGDALDLRVKAVRFDIDGSVYTAVAVSDIADEKRRKTLERIFFHDVLNTAGNLRGVTELFNEAGAVDREAFMGMAHELSEQLIDEIENQRQLSMAENGELIAEPEQFHSLSFLQELVSAYRLHPVGRSRILTLDPRTAGVMFTTDKTLLRRVVSNMIKNALEAAGIGETVTVGCRAEERALEFWVHNDTILPDAVRRQIFQRSFSTKGQGRGLGTYSVKLLTERYLGGTVGFTTAEGEGTRFYARIPLGL